MFQMLGFERKCSFDVDGDGADFSMSRSIDPKCASQKKGKGKGGSGGLRSWGEDYVLSTHHGEDEQRDEVDT